MHRAAREDRNRRIAAIDIQAYGKTRNHLDGRVTRLSPYLTHGFTDIPTLFERLPTLKRDADGTRGSGPVPKVDRAAGASGTVHRS